MYRPNRWNRKNSANVTKNAVRQEIKVKIIVIKKNLSYWILSFINGIYYWIL